LLSYSRFYCFNQFDKNNGYANLSSQLAEHVKCLTCSEDVDGLAYHFFEHKFSAEMKELKTLQKIT